MDAMDHAYSIAILRTVTQAMTKAIWAVMPMRGLLLRFFVACIHKWNLWRLVSGQCLLCSDAIIDTIFDPIDLEEDVDWTI